MVMEASGSGSGSNCHCRGGGQRLMRTSRSFMERSTERLTTTGTNSSHLAAGRQGERLGLAQPGGVHATEGPELPFLSGPSEPRSWRPCDWSPPPLPRGPRGSVLRSDLSCISWAGAGVSAARHQGCPHLKAQLGRVKGQFSPTESMLSSSLRVWASGALVKDRA